MSIAAMSVPVRVMIVDDHKLFNAALRRLLTDASGFDVVAEALDGATALTLATSLHPDVALIDISMPGMSGIELVRKLRISQPRVACVMLSMHAAEEYMRAAQEAGARGYVVKDAAPSELETAIRGAASGVPFFASRIGQHPAQGDSGSVDELWSLTDRQRQVLRLVALGYPTKQIATSLGLGVKTIDTHRAAIMRRLKLRNLPALVRAAIRAGLVSADE